MEIKRINDRIDFDVEVQWWGTCGKESCIIQHWNSSWGRYDKTTYTTQVALAH